MVESHAIRISLSARVQALINSSKRLLVLAAALHIGTFGHCGTLVTVVGALLSQLLPVDTVPAWSRQSSHDLLLVIKKAICM